MSTRITALESMEETSARVRQELRNIGIINLDLQRQVEDLERSQTCYDRALRNLSKINAELEDRDRSVQTMRGTIQSNDREIKRLQALLVHYQAVEKERTISVEATGTDAAALKSEDLNLVRHTLRAKIDENQTLRGTVRELETEVQAKQTQIGTLEKELDHLSAEFQKLFDRIPLQ
jgi:peptidoglycan hydrolase CwlO-like protein